MIRDIKFDNLRGLAIIMIVLDHFIGGTQLIHFYEFNFIYKFTYLFHLPLLIFISGYFSRDGPERSIKAFKAIFIPYLVFNTLWIIFAYLTKGQIPEMAYFIPELGLWYLLSLYFWKAFLPTASKIRFVFGISLILALLVGILNIETNFLSISRTLCYFPIFLLGFYFNDIKEKMETNKYLSSKVLAATILIPLLTLSTLYFMPLLCKVLILKYAYVTLGMGTLQGMGIRLWVLLVGMISSILLFTLMTSKETFLTKIGRNALTVYVLQFYFLIGLPIILKYCGLDYILQDYYLTIAYVILATILAIFISSRDTVRKAADIVIMRVTKILIKETPDDLQKKGKPS